MHFKHKYLHLTIQLPPSSREQAGLFTKKLLRQQEDHYTGVNDSPGFNSDGRFI